MLESVSRVAGYTKSMTVRVGPKGQVVIPKAVRDRLGIRPGDEVVVTEDERGALVQPVARVRDLRGAFAGLGLGAALEADRRTEPR